MKQEDLNITLDAQ